MFFSLKYHMAVVGEKVAGFKELAEKIGTSSNFKLLTNYLKLSDKNWIGDFFDASRSV